MELTVQWFFFCVYVIFHSILFTEFGYTWFCTGCTADPFIVRSVIVLIDAMLRSQTTNSSFHNQFESDIVGGDGTLLCSHWSRQVYLVRCCFFFTPCFFYCCYSCVLSHQICVCVCVCFTLSPHMHCHFCFAFSIACVFPGKFPFSHPQR